jgi:hypothetical protein
MNETLSLEFVHGIVVENKGIHVNCTSYAYLAYKKQRHLESSTKTQQKNLVQL